MLSFCKCSVVLTEREYKQSCVVQQLHKTRYTHTFMSCSTRKKPSSLKSTSLKSTIRSSTQSRSLSRGFSRTAGTYTQTDECSDMNVTLLRVQIASSRRNSHFPLVLGHASCQGCFQLSLKHLCKLLLMTKRNEHNQAQTHTHTQYWKQTTYYTKVLLVYSIRAVGVLNNRHSTSRKNRRV